MQWCIGLECQWKVLFPAAILFLTAFFHLDVDCLLFGLPVKESIADSKLPIIQNKKGLVRQKQYPTKAPSITNHKVLEAAFWTFNMCHNIAGHKLYSHLLSQAMIIRKPNIFCETLGMWGLKDFFMRRFIKGTSSILIEHRVPLALSAR